MLGISSFVKRPKHTNYDGEDFDEEILYVLRRSILTNIPWLFSTVIMVILPFAVMPYLRTFKYMGQPVVSYAFISVLTFSWYLLTFGYMFSKFLNWFFNVYIITNKKIVDIDFHGLLYKNIAEATLSNIEDVTSEVMGTIGVVFNIGDVYIQTAGEKREFDFVLVDNPSKLRDIISDLVAQERGPRFHKHYDRNN